MRKAGRGAGVCGAGDTGPGGEACSGSIPGAAWRGGRGRRASILSGGGDVRRELPWGGLESAARPPAASPFGATAR